MLYYDRPEIQFTRVDHNFFIHIHFCSHLLSFELNTP